jgi:hypothetical protein
MAASEKHFVRRSKSFFTCFLLSNFYFVILSGGSSLPYRKIIPGNRRALQNRGSRVRGCDSRRNIQPTKNRSAHIGMTTWSPVTKPGAAPMQ